MEQEYPQIKHVKCKTKHENIHVLDGLRTEMVQVENKRTTYTVYMYTVFFAVFAVAIVNYHELFLVALLVLLIFQAQINYKMWLMHKVSYYIYHFFEEPRGNMHWESMQFDSEYLDAERSVKKTFAMRVATHAATILACVTTSIELYFVILEIINSGGLFHNGACQFKIKCVGEMVLSLALCIAVANITKKSGISNEEKLDKAIQTYYRKYCEK